MKYLLAEPQQEILKQIYSGEFTKPQVNYLFDNTEMSSLKDVGPIFVSDSQVKTQTLKQLLEKNTGLLITSHYPQEQVLAQLRHNLLVYFKPEQLGIFRYYDPYIASYFFPSLNDQETAEWLGPIETLEWFNTDWRNKVTASDSWQEKHNPHAKTWQQNTDRLTSKPVLTKNQCLALQDMQEEKFAYHWQQNLSKNPAKINIDTIIYWVKQGIKQGFNDEDFLEQYLSVRARYPKGLPPEEWPTENLTDKLIYLEYRLKHNLV